MGLVHLKDRILAIPWVYDHVRPLVVGGLDLPELGRFCGIRKTDRVFDLGCGTAQLLDHFTCEQYLGVDLDAAALEKASRKSSGRVRFMQGDAWDAAYRELRPTVALMIGVVHHISDADFGSLVDRLLAADSLERIVTIEVTYFRRRLLNNLLSRLDRGRHVREVGRYEELFAGCGLRISRKEILSTRAGYVSYIGFQLGRREA
jgi:SAM-dependent methyltransferase